MLLQRLLLSEYFQIIRGSVCQINILMKFVLFLCMLFDDTKRTMYLYCMYVLSMYVLWQEHTDRQVENLCKYFYRGIWPKMFKMFKSIEKKLDYNTFYYYKEESKKRAAKFDFIILYSIFIKCLFCINFTS